MYTLIIKGDETAAFAACDLHNVEVTSIVKHERFESCIVTAPETTSLDTLARWFCEAPGSAPYPAGTLLWYGPRHPREAQEALVQNLKAAIDILEG